MVNSLELSDQGFSAILATIPQPPRQIYVDGSLPDFNATPCLAVVGSRKVSPYGRHMTTQLVGDLARRGVIIVSGLALGVDGIAHRAALDAGGITVAVLPGGLDHIYPSSHHHLAKEIVSKGGALISEYAPGQSPRKEYFIARNRLVSGLADGVLITEAAEKSGTLHTANFALDQGKTVLAVPGNATNPMSVGTNNLIKAGAIMVTEANDVFFALDMQDSEPAQAELFGANEAETSILILLKDGVTQASVLQGQSGLAPELFNQTLTMLELSGKIRALGSGQWSLK